MKTYLYAGALLACLALPAFAADSKLRAHSPEEPMHRRSILLCVGIVLGLQALKYAPSLPARRRRPTQAD